MRLIKKIKPNTLTIRTRLLLLLLTLSVVSLGTFAYLGVDAIRQAGRNAEQAGNVRLRTQIQNHLVQLTQANAKQNDLILERMRFDVEELAGYTASVFDNAAAFTNQVYWQPAEHMTVGPDGQYYNDSKEPCSVFVPNTTVQDDALQTSLAQTAYLDPILSATYNKDPISVAVYLGTEEEIVRYCPNIGLGTILPPDFETSQRSWYIGAAPSNNPEKKTIWTEVIEDATGQGLMSTISSPIYTGDGQFMGVVGIDVSLASIQANIEQAISAESGYSFLVDNNGRSIVLPPQGYLDILGRLPEPDEFGTPLDSAPPQFTNSILTPMQEGLSGVTTMHLNGRDLFIAYAPLESIGWALGTVVEADQMLAVVTDLKTEISESTTTLIVERVLPVGLVILVVVGWIGFVWSGRLVNPIQRLVAAAHEIGSGKLDVEIPEGREPEINALARALNQMSRQLGELIGSLEDRVEARTQRLEILAALSERLTAILDFEQLLAELVNQVKDNFNYYHAHVYTFDPIRQKLIMTAGAGQAGAQMKAEGHAIPLNAPTSLVARAARTGEIVRVDNVREAEDWLPNPLLPDTYSEMAVPITLEGEVIGVLDIQEDKIGGLDEGDTSLLRSLASQVAVAIRNARLFGEVESALARAQAAQEQYVEQAWQKSRSGRSERQYLYARPAAEPVDHSRQQVMATARQQALRQERPAVINLDDGDMKTQSLIAPITLRNKPIGTLQLHASDEALAWSKDDLTVIEAVLEQLAQTADNLRLFDQTRIRASREQIIREVTDRMRSANNLEDLLKITAQALGQRLSAGHAVIELGIESDVAQPGNGRERSAPESQSS